MQKTKNNSGQGLVEYLIVVALIAVASIAVLKVVGQNIQARLANVAYAIQGKNKSPRLNQIKSSHIRQKDMSDFFSGAAKSGKKK